MMLFQFARDRGGDNCTFEQLVRLGLAALALAQKQGNFHAEVRAVYGLARLILDAAAETVGGEPTLAICSAALPKLRRGMDVEDLYDMWCLVARAAEVLQIDGNSEYRNVEIKAYREAHVIAQRSLPDNQLAAARLLVLLIGDDIGTQPTDELQHKTNKRVQAIVDELEPLKILRWLNKQHDDSEYDETLLYIALCMMHGHVPCENIDDAMELFTRAKANGAAKRRLALWL